MNFGIPEDWASDFMTEDPGMRDLGWAWFRDEELWACGVSRCQTSDPRKAAHLHAETLREVCDRAGILWGNRRVVGEIMEQRGKLSEVKAADLLGLNLISGHLATRWLTPREWKGSLPREQEQERTRLTLSAEEMKILAAVGKLTKTGYVHNAWSAVAIGLACLGRKKDK